MKQLVNGANKQDAIGTGASEKMATNNTHSLKDATREEIMRRWRNLHGS